MSTLLTIGSLLHAYFEDYLLCQKGVQTTTIGSYRDTVKLFLQFLAADLRRKLIRLRLSDLTCDRVVRFLNYLENERGNAVATRNQRLAALRSLFEYLAGRVPEMLVEAHRVASVPTKRTAVPMMRFLQHDQIETLFKNLPTVGVHALRDRALLLFLYNTGARVREVAELRVGNLELGTKPRVHLHGKGDKWRTCPLWKQTGSLLSELLGSAAADPDAAVFVSRTGQALTRYGIYKIVRRRTSQCGIEPGSAVSPHCFRHTAASHLLQSGVEINVIRAWLGHVSLETTNRYVEINIQMKAQALEACEPPTDASPRKPMWRDDRALLEWLQSL